MARRDTYDHRGDAAAHVDLLAAAQAVGNGRARGKPPSGPGSAHDNRCAAGAGSAYTVMVAGQCAGKTSFLRLLLDTSDIAPNATPEQAADVARFVHGAASRTTHVRTASIEVQAAGGDGEDQHTVSLTVIDTPSLDIADDVGLDRSLNDMLNFLETKFAESIEDEQRARCGDHHVHLCIYLLDPDDIVPQPRSSLPPRRDSRARTDSFSGTLTPTESPLGLRDRELTPSLPAAEIRIIRQLSARVNVLPVIARADTVTTDRLAAIKFAVRRDLAEAGIGFGIFDVEYNTHLGALPLDRADLRGVDEHAKMSSKSSSTTAFSSHMSSSSSNVTSPPTSPVSPVLPKLPHAIMSPDMYGHDEGVIRKAGLSRQELTRRYCPPLDFNPPTSLSPSADVANGKFTRAYRWGSVNILDPNHCDFLHLRAAIFQHMQPLKTYTREYLYEKFRVEFHHQRQHLIRHPSPPSVSLPQVLYPPPHSQQLPPISTVAVDLDGHGRPGPSPELNHSAILMSRHPHPSLSIPYGGPHSGEPRTLPPISLANPHVPMSPGAQPITSATFSSSSSYSAKKETQKHKNKKITVACNFCRSRKLKCDGSRPTCGQCIKRSHDCHYTPQAKRRGGNRQQRQDDASDAEAYSSEDRSYDVDEKTSIPASEVSYPSPNDVQSRGVSRRSSNVDLLIAETLHSPPSLAEAREREGGPTLAPMTSPIMGAAGAGAVDPRGYLYAMEKPLIAPLPFSGANGGPSAQPSTSPPVPIRPASEAQAAQRKRAAISAGKGSRQSSNYGPKVVACNFCRARKTKCDGNHPNCSSCARRSLPCSYVNDPATNGAGSGKKKNGAAHTAAASSRSGDTSPTGTTGQGSAQDPQSPSDSRTHSPPAGGPGSPPAPAKTEDSPPAFKRPYADDEEGAHSFKKYRVGDDAHIRAGTPRDACLNGQAS